MSTDAPVPVTVITGFLGSGKTTLLNRLLAHPDLADTAVLVNEFGEIGLDHLLVREVDENVVLLNAGCLCCTVRGDLVDTLRDLFLKRVRGEVPAFNRVAVETTGLADPAPIIHTLMSDPILGARYRFDGIVTTVDAVNGASQMDTQPEPVKQAAVADRLVLTKADIADASALDGMRARLAQLNPAAPVFVADHGDVPPDALLEAGLFNTRDKIPDVERWLAAEAYAPAEGGGHGDDHRHGHGHERDHEHDHHHDTHRHDTNRHDDRIGAFCLTVDEPIVWDAFVSWVEMLLATKGEDVLRVKGVLDIEGVDHPVVVHGVQHVFHPPAALPAWPEGKRGSRLVMITRDLGQEAVEKTLHAFLDAAKAEGK